MKQQHDKFVQGCVSNGMDKKSAEKLWTLFEPFAGYGFGKAHAACYATIAYRTAYLKAHYPVEFMTAFLTAESRGASGPSKNEKIAEGVAECKRLNIKVLTPDINKSQSEFSIEGRNSIRFGLSAIKNIGEAAIKSMISNRSGGPFKNLEDFCQKVDLGAVNRKTIESLIKSGAMDAFDKRAPLLIRYSEILESAHKKKREKKEGQTSLFEESSEHKNNSTIDIEDFTLKEKLSFEKEFLGLYLTSHPMMDELSSIKNEVTHEIRLIMEESEGANVKIGGIIENMRRIFTKKTGSEMAFITIGDEKGITVECIIFPKIFEQYKNFLSKDTVIIVEGRVDTKNEKPVVIVGKVSGLNRDFSS